MTNFKTALQICGLSQQKAADFLDVRPDPVKSWSSGRNPVPDGVWHELGCLYERMVTAADDMTELIDAPCAGSCLTVAAMVKLNAYGFQ